MYNVGCCLNPQESLRLRLHFFIYILGDREVVEVEVEVSEGISQG